MWVLPGIVLVARPSNLPAGMPHISLSQPPVSFPVYLPVSFALRLVFKQNSKARASKPPTMQTVLSFPALMLFTDMLKRSRPVPKWPFYVLLDCRLMRVSYDFSPVDLNFVIGTGPPNVPYRSVSTKQIYCAVMSQLHLV